MTKQFLIFGLLLSCTLPTYTSESDCQVPMIKEVTGVMYTQFKTEIFKHTDPEFQKRISELEKTDQAGALVALIDKLDSPESQDTVVVDAVQGVTRSQSQLRITVDGKRIPGIFVGPKYVALSTSICHRKGWKFNQE